MKKKLQLNKNCRKVILYESSIVCVQQVLPNQSRGNAHFCALHDHEASLL
jgi:hypothetical protein